MTPRPRAGVSIVIPVRNGAGCLDATLDAVFGLSHDLPFEVIAVDDGSIDGSLNLLQRTALTRPLRIVTSDQRGAAAALNIGIRAASYPLIAQIDQDVVVGREWLRLLVAELEDPAIAAAQGQYVVDATARPIARAMALDLEDRYRAIDKLTDHVCTGNAIYRASALHQVGLFDESIGYGYDNDMSYRLTAAGYRLAFCREAHSHHRWRDTLGGYLSQQYGFGYGRLDVVAKHPHRAAGDAVSPTAMMVHGAVMTLAVLLWLAAVVVGAVGQPTGGLALAGVFLVLTLAAERGWAATRAMRCSGDGVAALLFVPLHLARDIAWVAAIAMWAMRRVMRRPSSPTHSMGRALRAGPDPDIGPTACETTALRDRVLGIIPAHNEVDNLAAVIADVRRFQPRLDILVIDDGSTDGSSGLLPSLGVRWLSFPERLGIGSAMRAGIRYAIRGGYDVCVRLDGDGQHAATDIQVLLAPIRRGVADVVLGSRFHAEQFAGSKTQVMRRLLAGCLSLMTKSRVTDPTSGFCAFGPRALRVLAEHHPTGYPEPELRLFLSRNHLRTVEVPVDARPRLQGKTSLTLLRLIGAGARVFLAILIVPLRRQVGGER